MSNEIITVEYIHNLLSEIKINFLLIPILWELKFTDLNIFKKNEKITKEKVNIILQDYNITIKNFFNDELKE